MHLAMTDMPDAMRVKLRNEKLDPQPQTFNTEIELPKRTQERNETLLPKFASSMTDNLKTELNCANPNAEHAAPRRQPRNDIELPSCRKSNAETTLPKRDVVRTEMLLPRFEKLRMDIDLPMRIWERRDVELPNITKSITEIQEPSLVKLRRLMELVRSRYQCVISTVWE